MTVSGLSGLRHVLLDIEGTTTPIAFVHEVLFPYAREYVYEYLEQHFRISEVQADLMMLADEHARDVAQGLSPPPLVSEGPRLSIASVAAYVGWLIDRDRKSTGLKSLEGKIWHDGYQRGILRAPIYEDVPRALERWHKAGIRTSIFSSGSIFAQKLLFAHTAVGDLTRFIHRYFDTTTGQKTDTKSYVSIAAALESPASEILFISDVTSELDAAAAAGVHVRLCIRPGNVPQGENHYESIKSFDEIG